MSRSFDGHGQQSLMLSAKSGSRPGDNFPPIAGEPTDHLDLLVIRGDPLNAELTRQLSVLVFSKRLLPHDASS